MSSNYGIYSESQRLYERVHDVRALRGGNNLISMILWDTAQTCCLYYKRICMGNDRFSDALKNEHI